MSLHKAYTVQQLRDALQAFPPELPVYVYYEDDDCMGPATHLSAYSVSELNHVGPALVIESREYAP